MRKAQGDTPQLLRVLILVLVLVAAAFFAFSGTLEDVSNALTDSGEDADDQVDEATNRAECYEKYKSQSRINSCLARVGS